VNRVSLRTGGIAAAVALSALFLSTACVANAAQPLGKNGVIYACFKAKGKSKGALRVVPSKRSCRKMRGWRPLSWGATGSPEASGQGASQGATGSSGQAGPKGNPGPEGKEGAQGIAGQVEKSLLDTIDTQTTKINDLTKQVTDLSTEVGDLEDTVDETCTQLTTVTKQADEVLESLLGTSVGGILGAVLNVPSPPDPLGEFECE